MQLDAQTKIGDVLAADGDRDGALAAYQTALALAERIGATDEAAALNAKVAKTRRQR